jgi:hypothetical protein
VETEVQVEEYKAGEFAKVETEIQVEEVQEYWEHS